ncbi:hypothetical protein LPJ57_010416, partial [Coemansia sp. RSA 486]
MSNFWGQNNRGRGRGRGRGGGGGGGGFGSNANDGGRGGANPLLSRLGNTSGQFGGQGYQAGGHTNSGGFANPGSDRSVSFADSRMVGNSGGTAQVSIKGWRGGTEDSLLKFLDTKLGRQAGVMDIHYRGEI